MPPEQKLGQGRATACQWLRENAELRDRLAAQLLAPASGEQGEAGAEAAAAVASRAA